MGFLLKTALFIVIVVLVGGYISYNYDDLKQKTTEFINPAIKEDRLLTELMDGLEGLGADIAGLDLSGESSEIRDVLERSQQLIAESEAKIVEVKGINDKKISTISSGIGRINDLIRKPIEIFTDPAPAASFSYETDDGEYTCELNQ
ncbi:MAG: hypothetical protein ABH833_02370 [Parcubacteria group bacterium]